MKNNRAPFRLALRRRAKLDVEEEFAFHIEMRTAELVKSGLDPHAARREAERQFGDLDDARRFCGETDERRELRNMNREYLQETRQDISFALRALRRSPAFSVIAILTLALGIGANTAIFSVVRGILLRPMPFANPGELVMLAPLYGGERSVWSPANIHDVREQTKSFTTIATIEGHSAVLTGVGNPLRLRGFRVSADFFPMLGLRPTKGRLSFTSEEAAFNGAKAVIIHESLWRTRFGSDSTLVGRTITLDNEPYRVVGVAPNDAVYPSKTEVWFPFTFDPKELAESRGAVYLSALARLKHGVPLETAIADVRGVTQRLVVQYPEMNRGMGATVVPLSEWITGDLRRPLFILLGGVAFVLLIACANVANLMLVRGVARESELAVRTALGAGRGRLIRQLATESVVLSVIGGAAGLAIAVVGTKVLLRMAPSTLPRLYSVQIDSMVLLFTALLSLLTGLLFGLLPSRQTARRDIATTLRDGSRGAGMRRSSHHARRLLVVVELALSVMLLAGAGLLIRSFGKLTSVDPGFRTDNAVSFSISLPEVKYLSEEQQRMFMASMLERVRSLGGIERAGAAIGMPLTSFGFTFSFAVSGRVYKSPADEPAAEVRVATPDYLPTMGIPMLKGRNLNATDRNGSTRAMLITESAVRKFFPGEEPLGKHIKMGWGRNGSSLEGDIVGVVGDIKQTSLADKPLPQFYVAFDQWPVRSFNVVIRSSRDLNAIAREATTAIHEIDPDLAVSNVKPLTAVVAESVARPRFYMMLLTVFAVLALLLSSVGIYGVIAYLVGQRTREIGIRVALGASRGSVMRLVAREGLSMTFLGLVTGLAGAIGLSRLISALLFETAPTDFSTFAMVIGLLTIVAVLASLVPAFRAARIDPVLAIRSE